MKKAGYVAVIGKTNAGKSTLVNRLIGQKINIVSPKPQTTRNNVLGVLTDGESQMIFIDTPGIHRSVNQLDKYMSKNVRSASEGADIIVYLIDGSKNFDDEEIANIENLVQKNRAHVILAVSKLDIVNKEKLFGEMTKLNSLGVKEIIPISAEKNKNINELKQSIIKFLPEQEFIFPEDEITDKSISFLCAEIVREKVLRFTNQEIPHGVMCLVTQFEEKKNITHVSVDIICEKESHKAIIIGKQGDSIKRIGASSRIDMEKLLDTKVMLNLFVKVEKDWRNKVSFLTDGFI